MTLEIDRAARPGAGPPALPSGSREQRRAWLADRILDELARRELPAGAHLAETALADALGVSRSPIRAALKLLADRGVLRHRRNHGYFLVRDAGSLVGLAPSVSRAPEDALYRAILDDRLAERLSGSVTQVELIRRYGVSERRVVAVLSRLREEGLVRRNPGRGWSFEPAINNAESLRQSYAIRLILEPAALDLPGLAVDHAALERARQAHRALLAGDLVLARVFEVDAGFHEMLASFSSNPYVLDVIQQQNRLRRMLEFLDYTDPRRIGVWAEEHLAIIDALARGHRRKAVRLLRTHLERARRSMAPD